MTQCNGWSTAQRLEETYLPGWRALYAKDPAGCMEKLDTRIRTLPAAHVNAHEALTAIRAALPGERA